MFTQSEVINNLREERKKLEDKIEAIKTWAETYIDPYLEVDESNITLFRSEGLELKKILEDEGHS